ncbi:MAG: hypothetical protein HN348_29980 [Proteobacteria bacterium]|nr:hypothetical protein [Pseudomonadota bacterium]
MRLSQITFASHNRPTLFTSHEEFTWAAATIARTTHGRAILFCAADDHGHVVFAGDRFSVGRICSGMVRALNRELDHRVKVSIWPVDGRKHLETLISYVLNQTKHHGIQSNPTLWPGSCFHDLIGARLLPGFDADLLRRILPRLRDETIYAKVNLPPLVPASDEQLSLVGLKQLRQSATRTLPQPHGYRGRPSRTATVQLARQLGFQTAEIARALHMSPRTIRELTAAPREPTVEYAIRMQVSLLLANQPDQART